MLTFNDIVHARRTNKNFDGSAVSKDDLQQLLEWAIRAPNHRLNQPWRFRVFEQAAVNQLCAELQQKWSDEEKKTYQAAFDKFSKVGAMIYVSVLRDDNQEIDQENYAAACAATQNILLGAASLGIESFWSTGKLMKCPTLLRHLEWQEQSEQWVGAIWLGYGPAAELKPRKSLEDVMRWWS